MSVVATERFTNATGVREISGNWTGVRAWDVIGMTASDPIDQAINATGVLVGSPYPNTTSLVCKQIGVTENKLTMMTVVANYGISTIVANDPNPLLRAPVISWKRSRQSLPVDTDINGNPILNSATDAFRSNSSRNFNIKFLTFKRWESSYNQSLADAFDNAVNSDSFTIQGITYSPGQAQLVSYVPIEEYQETARFVHVCYELEIRTPSGSGLTALQQRHPFQRRLMDQGLRGIYQDPNNSNTKTLGNFFLGGSGGQQCNRDVLLNGQGVPIDSTIVVTQAGYTAQTQTLPSTVLVDSATTGANFLIYFDYAELPFAALGIS